MPSPAEMRHGLETLMQAGKKVDYILTHEPSGKCRGLLESRGARLDGLNIYFNQLEEHVEYQPVVFRRSIWTRPLPPPPCGVP